MISLSISGYIKKEKGNVNFFSKEGNDGSEDLIQSTIASRPSSLRVICIPESLLFLPVFLFYIQ